MSSVVAQQSIRKVTISNSKGMPPYSPACLLDDKYVFISGQVALDPNATGPKVLVGGDDVGAQATQVLKNVSALLAQSGSSWGSACFVQIFLTDISNYGALNAAYEAALQGVDKPPTRACFAVKRLPRGALCEIECIALKDGSSSRETIPGNKLFSKAVITDDLVFVAGQLALDPSSGTKELVSKGDPAGEARQALKNVQSILEASGSSLDNVVKVTVLLNSIESYAAVNEAYKEFFKSNPPARAAFEVKQLPLSGEVEIYCTAVKNNGVRNIIAGRSAVPVYSPAIIATEKKVIFVSGQVALNPENTTSKELVGGDDVAKQAAQAISNLKKVLESSGTTLANVCKVNIFIMNMDDYGKINEVYINFFGKEKLPARAVVQVANLPLGALVELECVACC